MIIPSNHYTSLFDMAARILPKTEFHTLGQLLDDMCPLPKVYYNDSYGNLQYKSPSWETHNRWSVLCKCTDHTKTFYQCNLTFMETFATHSSFCPPGYGVLVTMATLEKVSSHDTVIDRIIYPHDKAHFFISESLPEEWNEIMSSDHGTTSDDEMDECMSEVDPHTISKKIKLIEEYEKDYTEEIAEFFSLVRKHFEWVYIDCNSDMHLLDKDEIEEGFIKEMPYKHEYLRMCSDDEDVFIKACNRLLPECSNAKVSRKVVNKILKPREKYILCTRTSVSEIGDHIQHLHYDDRLKIAATSKDVLIDVVCHTIKEM